MSNNLLAIDIALLTAKWVADPQHWHEQKSTTMILYILHATNYLWTQLAQVEIFGIDFGTTLSSTMI